MRRYLRANIHRKAGVVSVQINRVRMKSSVRALALCLGLMGAAVTAPAVAQPSSEYQALHEQIQRLEREMDQLQEQSYRRLNNTLAQGAQNGLAQNRAQNRAQNSAGANPVVPAAADAGFAIAQLQNRMAELERAVSQLTGQIEEQAYRLRLLNRQVELMASGGPQGPGPAGVDPAYGDQPGSGLDGRRPNGTAPQGRDGAPQTLGYLREPRPEAESQQRQFGSASQVQTLSQQSRAADSGQSASSDRNIGTAAETEDLQARDPQAEQASGESAASPFIGSEQQMFDRAYGLLFQGKYGEAAEGFTAYLDVYPQAARAGEAIYWLGEAHFAQSRFGDASRAFYRSAQDYPDGAKAPASLFKLAMSLDNLGQTDQVCGVLNKLRDDYPSQDQRIKQNAGRLRDKAQCR